VREIFRHQRVTDILAVHREHPAGAAARVATNTIRES
jgi:hypothetical protein